MNLHAAENLAFELLLKHGLRETRAVPLGNSVWYPGHKPWRFEFDSSKRRFGLCSHRDHTISLSESITLLNDEATVRDTILHEIAHALVGNGHGHDETWKAKCREIGAKPERCYDGDDVITPPAPFEATCPGCGAVHERHRLPDEHRKFSCGKCSRRGYNERFRLMWHRHGTPQPPLPQPLFMAAAAQQPKQTLFFKPLDKPAEPFVPVGPIKEITVTLESVLRPVFLFDAARAVELYKAGQKVVDIAVAMGYKRGHGQNRTRAALIAAGVYIQKEKQ